MVLMVGILPITCSVLDPFRNQQPCPAPSWTTVTDGLGRLREKLGKDVSLFKKCLRGVCLPASAAPARGRAPPVRPLPAGGFRLCDRRLGAASARARLSLRCGCCPRAAAACARLLPGRGLCPHAAASMRSSRVRAAACAATAMRVQPGARPAVNRGVRLAAWRPLLLLRCACAAASRSAVAAGRTQRGCCDCYRQRCCTATVTASRSSKIAIVTQMCDANSNLCFFLGCTYSSLFLKAFLLLLWRVLLFGKFSSGSIYFSRDGCVKDLSRLVCVAQPSRLCQFIFFIELFTFLLLLTKAPRSDFDQAQPIAIWTPYDGFLHSSFSCHCISSGGIWLGELLLGKSMDGAQKSARLNIRVVARIWLEEVHRKRKEKEEKERVAASEDNNDDNDDGTNTIKPKIMKLG
ncbi:hypothetical protein C4D60_Mb02t15050 [Musa balbisiana]|uniref:Uncharacterized protein n=1 Tax=Musa balbisiana TaxID=52838 RepID=A0A4S8IAX3_MUSBA|nr:hypothetical protein C4D60_Mb02t15050 [Musa balbisiana]